MVKWYGFNFNISDNDILRVENNFLNNFNVSGLLIKCCLFGC